MRRICSVAAAMVVAFGAGLAVASPASATYCTASAHCAAVALWPVFDAGSGFNGATADLRSNCMSLPNWTTRNVGNALWVQNTQDTSSAHYWVETGITFGAGTAGTVSSPTYYWADNRPGTNNFHEHLGNTYAFGAYVKATISANATVGSWAVTVGSLISNSTGNFSAPSRYVFTGAESGDDGGQTYGSSSNLGYKSLTNSWVFQWASGSSAAITQSTPVGSNMHATWALNQEYHWVQTGQGPTC